MIRRRVPAFILIAAGVAIVGLLFLLLLPSEARQATNIVDSFYSYEQASEFSSSWDLFHPSMHQKFSKGTYIQDRAHVFMNHFGVDTFSYSLSRPTKRVNWKMTDDGEPFEVVYEVVVTQVYNGKYGKFELVQPVYVAEDAEGWALMWDYQE
ncbi:hypothetical protein [Bacillus solitudinis]|uniref:hypothetical protein n=1 Tax=Bacillus solitudinis TaxID=2014074 RepID=UPI000C2356BE|nr:hypothetical protein [Bacillus solitudinis]